MIISLINCMVYGIATAAMWTKFGSLASESEEARLLVFLGLFLLMMFGANVIKLVKDAS